MSLCIAKSAQRSLVLSLAKAYEPLGIHVALVTVSALIRPKDTPEGKFANAERIAEVYWDLVQQKDPKIEGEKGGYWGKKSAESGAKAGKNEYRTGEAGEAWEREVLVMGDGRLIWGQGEFI
jgi:hypothetical protein